MINLCLVVIATQFSETKKRETERMIAERRRFSRSSSTLLSDAGTDPGSCWEEFIKFVCHLFRKSKRKLARKYFQYKAQKELVTSESVSSFLDSTFSNFNLNIKEKPQIRGIEEFSERGTILRLPKSKSQSF
jgi:hypothetical protein